MGEGFFIQSPSILGNYVSSRLKRFRSKTFLLYVKIADFYYNFDINLQFKAKVFQTDVQINAFSYLIANESTNFKLLDLYIEKGVDIN